MANILTQEEISALMTGISSGEVPTGQEASGDDASGVRAYDLAGHDRIVHGRIPAVEVMVDRWVHELTGTFTSAFRRMVEVMPSSPEVKRFRDFLGGLPVPASIHIVRMGPRHGPALLVLEANLVYLLVEFIMGGNREGQLTIEGREFTNIENRLIRRIAKEILGDLEAAWSVLQPAKVEVERVETNPQLAAVLLPSDQVLCIRLTVEMEVASGGMLLCLPLAMVEPFRDRLPGMGSQPAGGDRRWMSDVLGHVLDAPVTLSVELGGAGLTVQDILNLEVGHLLGLDQAVDGLLLVKVEGVPKFLAHPGHANGKKAVRVARLMSEDAAGGALGPQDPRRR